MKIYQSMKDLVTRQRIAKAAETLGEKESNVASAVSVILPSLLGVLHSKGATPQVKDTIGLAGKHGLLKDLDRIFEGSGVIDGMNLGERFENALIGVNNQNFRKAVADKAGVKVESADRLTNWVAATIAAWFGDMTVRQNNSLTSLMQQLGGENAEIVRDVPENIARQLNLVIPAKCSANAAPAAPVSKKRNYSWVWWLLAILAIAIIAFLLFRSCDRKKVAKKEPAKIENTATTSTARKEADDLLEFTLPNNVKIMAKKNGTEAKMIEFLKSDEYRNATEAHLRNKWFHFDYIDFEHDSATDMTPGSKAQLRNIATILKAFPDAKIRIGGYADKTGTVAVNDEISKERAEYVKSVFAQNGIDAGRVSTVGFGEEYATRPVSATDAERAIDRHIALRFEK